MDYLGRSGDRSLTPVGESARRDTFVVDVSPHLDNNLHAGFFDPFSGGVIRTLSNEIKQMQTRAFWPKLNNTARPLALRDTVSPWIAKCEGVTLIQRNLVLL